MAFRTLSLLVLALDAAAEVADVPASEWCAWVPMGALAYVDDCKSNGTEAGQLQVSAGCADWCLWVPGPSWKSIEVCHDCADAAEPESNATAEDHAETEPIGEPKPEAAPSLRAKSLAYYPNWCSTIPLGSLQYVPACRGYRGSNPYFSPYCSNWCQWVPSPSWQYVSACQGCYGKPLPVGQPSGPYRGGCASWCQWVPTLSWQYTSGCSGCF